MPDGLNRGSCVIDATTVSLLDWCMRRIVIPLYPGCQPLDVVGPREVFRGANEWMDVNGLPGERYDIVMVAIDGEHVRSESDMWTSAGVTAGIDLGLAMVEEDCGAEIAQQVARRSSARRSGPSRPSRRRSEQPAT